MIEPAIADDGPEACTPSATRAIGQDAAVAVAGSLKALADPLRLRMLSAIATDPRGETCVCDLAALAEVSQPTISHHLKVLRQTGLLLSERRGTWVYYRIAPRMRSAISALLDNFAPSTIVGDAPENAEGQADAPGGLDHLVARLADEYAGEYAGPTRDLVTSIVRESHAGLIRAATATATATRHPLSLTERFARQRLADLERDRGSGAPQVLFVCVQNAGRSQLAAALVNRLSGGAVIARSAGSAPAADVHAHVRSLLAEIEGAGEGSRVFPKPLTDDAVRAADVVITMGCGDVCPIIPGIRYEDWAVGDPALASPEGIVAIRDDIEGRVRGLLAALTSKA